MLKKPYTEHRIETYAYRDQRQKHIHVGINTAFLIE